MTLGGVIKMGFGERIRRVFVRERTPEEEEQYQIRQEERRVLRAERERVAKKHQEALAKAREEGQRNLELERATRTRQQSKQIAGVEHKERLKDIRASVKRKHKKIKLPKVGKGYDFSNVAFGEKPKGKKGRGFDPVFG